METPKRPKSLDRLFGERTAEQRFEDEIREQIAWLLANEDEIRRKYGRKPG